MRSVREALPGVIMASSRREKNFGRKPLTPFTEVMEIILRSASTLGSEEIALDEAAGRVLAEDVVSSIDMPPFNKSAMDGFACRRADLDMPLKIVETAAAGRMPEKEIGRGECTRIMTGAAVPGGADTVVMLEDTEESDGTVRILRRSSRSNICPLGEDIRGGETVLKRGTLLRPPEIAVLAAAGTTEISVAVRPSLGIAVTGNELAEPGRPAGPGMIWNSNGPQLVAQAVGSGLPAEYLGIVPDEPGAVPALTEKAEAATDIFIFSGGISMGDYDFVPEGLEEAGFELLVHGAAIKPGRPLLFGRKKGCWVFGLPGNPVSVFVLFEVVVKPFCFKVMGHEYRPLEVAVRLESDFNRKDATREAHIPVVLIPGGRVRMIEYHGSAHIHSYTKADGIMRIPAGVSALAAGEEVKVIIPGPPLLGRESRDA
jgi:molybdopterin molybdotransferase